MLLVITEELERTAALRYVIKKCNIANDLELSIEYVIKLGLKYPVMFYPIERFRKHLKRILFGDKFWVNKKVKKTKFPDSFGDYSKKSDAFSSAKASIKETCLAIISDCYLAGRRVLELKEQEEYMSREEEAKQGEENKIEIQEFKDNQEGKQQQDAVVASSSSCGREMKSLYDLKSHRFDGSGKIPLTTAQREKLTTLDKLTAEILKNEVG
jgi:hypothetical protein